MFLQPKKIKYKKLKKGTLQRLEFKTIDLKFGTIGLKTRTSGLISARQLEAARRAIIRKIKRKGKLWLRVFPHLPITSKPNESRMGKGKGSLSYWATKVFAGTVLFELCGIPKHTATEALNSGKVKLPVKTKIID